MSAAGAGNFTQRVGALQLTVQPHWWSGHGVAADTWRWTVTVDTEYGPAIMQHSTVRYRGNSAGARAEAITRGQRALEQLTNQ